MAEYGRRGRPYYYKAQLMDAISLLESGRPDKARRLLQITLDVCDGKRPMEQPDDHENVTLRMGYSR
jgi:hypothetical protein